jgi:hypothetical protein
MNAAQKISVENDLPSDIEKAAAHVQSLRSQRARARNRYEAKIASGDSRSAIGQARHSLDLLDARVVGAEKKLRALQMRAAEQQELNDVRHDDDTFPAAMTPPHAGWTLRANRTLNLGGKVVSRGQEISTDDLSMMLNAPALLAGGHVRWCPPVRPAAVTPRPAPQLASMAQVTSSETEPENVITKCKRAIREAAAARGISRRAAVDVIDQELLRRAILERAQKPRTVMSGSWADARPTVTGQGSGGIRRITDDVIDYLCSDELEPEAA